MVLLVGPSGCGKTTLLRRLADEVGLRGVSSGELHCEAKSYGYVWQDPGAQLVTHRVESEIVFGMENLGFTKAEMERRLAEVVTFFGLEDLVHREVSGLSAGEQQLVNIAGAIAVKPELLLLDEPTSALDPMAAERLAGLIRKIHRELGTTVILAEQRPEIFFEMTDHIICMEEGGILYQGDYEGFINFGRSKEFLPASVRLAIAAGAASDQVADPLSRRRWWQGNKESAGHFSESSPGSSSEQQTVSKEILLRAKHIWFRYEKKSPDVLKDCSLDLPTDQITAIVGGNGSGKTTLAQILAGYLAAYRGDCSWYGDEKRMLRSRRACQCHSVSFLPSNPAYIITDPALLDASGGEREWTGIELVLEKEAELYILDEPTKGLDPGRKDELTRLLKEKARLGKTVLLVTHDIEFAAVTADVMALMYDGRIVACENKEKFLTGNVFYTTELQRLLSWD